MVVGEEAVKDMEERDLFHQMIEVVQEEEAEVEAAIVEAEEVQVLQQAHVINTTTVKVKMLNAREDN